MITNSGFLVSMTRGDDVAIHVDIKSVAADGTKTDYTMEEGDTLTLTVKYNSEFGDDDALIQKIYTTPDITIEHDDTKDLDYGLYLYDIVLTAANGNIYTLIMSTLELTKEGGI